MAAEERSEPDAICTTPGSEVPVIGAFAGLGKAQDKISRSNMSAEAAAAEVTEAGQAKIDKGEAENKHLEVESNSRKRLKNEDAAILENQEQDEGLEVGLGADEDWGSSRGKKKKGAN